MAKTTSKLNLAPSVPSVLKPKVTTAKAKSVSPKPPVLKVAPKASTSKLSKAKPPKAPANAPAPAAQGRTTDKSGSKVKPGLKRSASISPAPKKRKTNDKLAAAQASIRVFQTYSQPWQRELLTPGFAAIDVSRVSGQTRDLDVWMQLQAGSAVEGAHLWGAVSWQFAERAGMDVAEWVRRIQAQPGADVYFSCPASQQEAVFHNPWLAAQTQHPRFLEVAGAFLEATGLPAGDLSAITSSASACSSNWVVATPRFWTSYLSWLGKLIATADKRMSPALRDFMHAPLSANGAAGAEPHTLLALIIERLFTLYIRQESKTASSFIAVKVPLPARESELNVHQKLLREMKDVAHRTQSAWLAACWVNYRNLYLGQTQDKAWVQQHLRAITPPALTFA